MSCSVRTEKSSACYTLGKDSNYWENDLKLGAAKKINVLVQFRSDKIGSYGEEVVFDFGGYPKVVKKLGVQVGDEESLTKVFKPLI